MNFYFAFSEEHNLRFWRLGDCGYTFIRGKAAIFDKNQVLSRQIRDPHSQWEFILRESDFEKIDIGGQKIWVISAEDRNLLEKFRLWCQENSPGHTALVNYETRHL